MGIDGYITLAVIVVAFMLFATEYFTIDLVAISMMIVLVLTGVLSAEDGVKGFANPATITVAAMFVLSDALLKTGIIEAVAPFLLKLVDKGLNAAVLGIMATVGISSAFVNNTPIVATFIPVIGSVARKSKTPSSKLLIPLSYGAILGGCCTLIGTSTNLLVSGIAQENGLEAFSMFLMAPLGLVLFAAGVLYMMFIGKHLIPAHSETVDLKKEGGIKNYLAEIKVVAEPEPDSERVITIENIFKQDGLEVQVERVSRKGVTIDSPDLNYELHKDDVLLVKGDMNKMKSILENDALSLMDSASDKLFPEEDTRLVEIVILPNSELSDKKIGHINFQRRYHSNVMAIRQRGRQKFEDLEEIYLRAGDILLLETSERGYEMLIEAERLYNAPFLSMREIDVSKVNKGELAIVGVTILIAILLASFNIVPIMVGALAASGILIFMNITTMQAAYKAIDWKVIILLAGALSLGEAMNQSGVSQQIADLLSRYIGESYGPVVVVSVLYLVTSFFTEVMSNNAAAALLAPIAISLAASLQVDAVPLLLAITFAGSASFMTPIGYQTNTMVYSAGNYKFKDFLRTGTPLNFLLWIIATFLIPVFYPF